MIGGSNGKGGPKRPVFIRKHNTTGEADEYNEQQILAQFEQPSQRIQLLKQLYEHAMWGTEDDGWTAVRNRKPKKKQQKPKEQEATHGRC